MVLKTSLNNARKLFKQCVAEYPAKVVNTVVVSADKIDFTNVVEICNAFSKWSASEGNQELFEANKRIENILSKMQTQLI